ncbi:ATP-dependent RNA helicase A-like protein [Oryzias melastigma]|uniref:ATP-dependent RNA helicase A-like protein n=1 Tax=Oryzias melastigma TaxID=30732 RepID=A0A834F6X4_ORYME|nr:ATP-dependent RNA helicase A-like protein [Oryzias melastigma]
MEEHAGQTEQGYPPRGGYGDGGGAEWDRGANLKEYYARRDEQEAQATLESEEVDLNANLHGNWTLENAKARLNRFFQQEKMTAEYKYSQVGPDHNRSGSALPHQLSDQIQADELQVSRQSGFGLFRCWVLSRQINTNLNPSSSGMS